MIAALFDTGITLDHPDLEANIWTRPRSRPGRVRRRRARLELRLRRQQPLRSQRHGTHVAGIIGEESATTGWRCGDQLVGEPDGAEDLERRGQLLAGRVDRGARIRRRARRSRQRLSFRQAPTAATEPEEEAIRAAGKAGLLYVAAAGNDDSDDDVDALDPGELHRLENIISVAATTRSETLTSFSDDVPTASASALPARGSLARCRPAASTARGRGTANSAAPRWPHRRSPEPLRCWSEHPTWTMQQIRARLLSTARSLPSLFGKVSTCGELDIGAATNPAIAEPGLTVHRADGHRVGFGQLIAGWCRMRRRWLVQRDVRARNASHADRHAPGRLDLRALARGLHRHGFVHRLTDDGQHRHGGLRHHRGQPGLGRRAAVSPQRARTVRPWIEP